MCRIPMSAPAESTKINRYEGADYISYLCPLFGPLKLVMCFVKYVMEPDRERRVP
uniref:NADH-quinone oxidoreductase subunit I n=1 Tax=Heterorhabditis bacteriophora TaxID=37862 RepID=A0A1I7X596_HETBA